MDRKGLDWKGIPAGYSSLGIASIYWSTVAFEYSNEPWPPSTFASSSPSHSVSRLYVLERDCLSRLIITDNFDDFDNIERGDSVSITLYCFYCFEINPARINCNDIRGVSFGTEGKFFIRIKGLFENIV